MELSYVLDPRRWQARFKTEADVRAETIAAGQAPDATVDEVGSAPAPEGFEGTALHGHTGSGYGTAIPAVRGGPAGARRRTAGRRDDRNVRGGAPGRRDEFLKRCLWKSSHAGSGPCLASSNRSDLRLARAR